MTKKNSHNDKSLITKDSVEVHSNYFKKVWLSIKEKNKQLSDADKASKKNESDEQ